MERDGRIQGGQRWLTTNNRTLLLEHVIPATLHTVALYYQFNRLLSSSFFSFFLLYSHLISRLVRPRNAQLLCFSSVIHIVHV